MRSIAGKRRRRFLVAGELRGAKKFRAEDRYVADREPDSGGKASRFGEAPAVQNLYCEYAMKNLTFFPSACGHRGAGDEVREDCADLPMLVDSPAHVGRPFGSDPR